MKSVFDLSGCVVLVTGATGYLGRAICFGLGEAGACVLVNSRKKTKACALVSEIQAKGMKAEIAVFDVTDENSIKKFFECYQGKINVIINNAYAGGGGTIKTSFPTQYRKAYDIVVTSAHTLLRAALSNLRLAVDSDGDASVINISSMYGIVSPDQRLYDSESGTNPPFYGAAKAALVQWSKYAACEFGKERIRFNTISPGPFPNKNNNTSKFMFQLESKVPLCRVGEAKELIGPVIFLSSKASTYVTGANLAVDGGWTAW